MYNFFIDFLGDWDSEDVWSWSYELILLFLGSEIYKVVLTVRLRLRTALSGAVAAEKAGIRSRWRKLRAQRELLRVSATVLDLFSNSRDWCARQMIFGAGIGIKYLRSEKWRMCLDHLSSDALQSRSLLLTRNLNLSLSILKRRRATPREDRTSVLEMEVILLYLLNSALLTNVLWAFVQSTLIPFLSRSLRQAGRWWFQEFLRPRWLECVHYKHTLLLLFLDPILNEWGFRMAIKLFPLLDSYF